MLMHLEFRVELAGGFLKMGTQEAAVMCSLREESSFPPRECKGVGCFEKLLM